MTIRATGHLTDPPTLLITGGAGNEADIDEVHLMLRANDGEQTLLVIGWFPLEEVRAALDKAAEISRQTRRKR